MLYVFSAALNDFGDEFVTVATFSNVATSLLSSYY